MKISVEISMYPLDDNFGAYILKFINQLNTYSSLSIKTNSMSTQIFGEYEAVMDAIKNEMEPIFAEKYKTVMVMKFINADLDYEFS